MHDTPNVIIDAIADEWGSPECTAATACAKLASPDVEVTNQSDKDVLLPKILGLDERVKKEHAARGVPVLKHAGTESRDFWQQRATLDPNGKSQIDLLRERAELAEAEVLQLQAQLCDTAAREAELMQRLRELEEAVSEKPVPLMHNEQPAMMRSRRMMSTANATWTLFRSSHGSSVSERQSGIVT